MTYRAIYNDQTLSCQLTDHQTAVEFAKVVSTKSKYVVALVGVQERGSDPVDVPNPDTLWDDFLTRKFQNHAQPAQL